MKVPSRLPSTTRRRLLQALAASGFLGFVERNVAQAQGAPDYKALVCVFQLGGNDGENTLIRYDTAGYQNYEVIRPPGWATERSCSPEGS